ncbi:GMC family oxidoreductase [Ruegeria aquimaris]|uniref:GMC family oxidoreductase N-terminal domain-containing protein n=1 Tax=Ruegeria aquimaris TaxID=2984333 RepID=A0ABT3AKD6_9RHOB|nr:GMC family oxidoreductase N-terminal domain-containing protein [Ruegeria sp. XHP0148]MCV2889131.1 GMC family oxidoreductase N-terminal domain-containing protein [Ruegeria sp. XHP0148]
MTKAPEFDFIIVGAGSAGCVLADRLTECGRFTVQVIEAGGSDQKFFIKMPMGYGLTFSDARVNWKYQAEPDPGLGNRIGYWPRGKVIGGSSSINAMAYMRGLPHDFDDWAKAGATGWDWKTVQETYEALETVVEADGTTCGSGPIVVSDLRNAMSPFSRHFLDAARDLNWPVLGDLNGSASPGQNQHPNEGMGYMRATVRNGRRWSAADVFLRRAIKRHNLSVVIGARVERILTKEKLATGVRYRVNGEIRETSARREVILSAGAIDSPKLLMLSGIGPAADLRTLGIDMVLDQPQVGQGLQDHLAVSHYYWAKEATLNSILGRRTGQFRAGVQYLLTRGGPLSVPVNQVSGYLRTSGALVPDVQVYCNPATYATLPDGAPLVDRDNGFLLCVQPCRPTSRGWITLRSADPAAAPRIQPNSLSTAEDQRTAVAASHLLQQLAQSPTLQRVTRARRDPDILEMDDDALLENFRQRAGTVFHASCTCRMGDGPDTSVTDNRLRVHGIGRLRVIDASAFPNVTSGNTNAPTMMLADRAARMVIEDNLGRSAVA